MIITMARRRLYLCNTVLAVLFIVLLAAVITELLHYRLNVGGIVEHYSISNPSTIPLPKAQAGPSPSDGIPYILKTLHSYLEPHPYRIRHVSETEIVCVVGQRLDKSPNSGRDINSVLSLKHASKSDNDIHASGGIMSNATNSNAHGSVLKEKVIDSTDVLNTDKTSEAGNVTENSNETSADNSLQTTRQDNPVSSTVLAANQSKRSKSLGGSAIEMDPLVIYPRPNSSLRSVSFSFRNNGSYWSGRPLMFTSPGKQDLKEEQYAFLQRAVWNGGWNISQLADYSLESVMQPWEWDIYKNAALNNIKETVDELYSKVELLNASESFSVGDVATIRVDLYDGYGRTRTKGGDDVRVWLKDDATANGLSVDVMDLHNGSYLASIPLLFEGTPKVKVSVTYPREILRVVFYLRNVMKGMRLNVGGFVSEFASEATICSPFPFSGGYPELCNLTSLNYNLSWYCGRPTNPVLKCHHWRVIRDLEFPNPLPVTEAEREWFDRLVFGRRNHLRLVSNPEIQLMVLPGPARVVNISVTCNMRPMRDSWTERAPRGFYLHGQWTPTGCALPHVDLNTINSCLRGSTLYMIGDSNLRHMLEMFAQYGLCAPVTVLLGKLNWHTPQLCVNHQYKYLVRWRTHALPFHTNTDHWAPKTNQQSVGLSMDEIPATGKYIVLLHMYLHFTTHHYSVYVERIRAMREAVERLLARNPRVQVVIRGPHAAFKGWNPMLGGDAHAKLYISILKAEFRNLYDKVLLLDFWEMTVAEESEGFHPLPKITQQMIRILFGFVCR